MKKTKPTSSADFGLLAITAIILVFGFVMLASASSDLAKLKYDDSYFYIKHQLINGLIPGLLGFLAASLIYYRRWEKFAVPLLFFSLLFLILIFTPIGVKVGGAARWISVGGFTFQPSEFLKLAFIIYMASWISRDVKRGERLFTGFIPFLVVSSVIAFLLFKQPSTTNAILLFASTLIMYFAAGARFRILAIFALVGLLTLSLLVYFTPYRLTRITTYLNFENADKLGVGYHADQALSAIGQGGLMGVGYGKSTTKLHYLPEPVGDSIFAVIGEELGFVGAVSLIFLFLCLIYRGLAIARKTLDPFGRLVTVGFISIIGLQTFVNIGAVSGLLPLTGVPLPFVSYGGTALAVFLTMIGIILNISRHRR